MKNVFSRYSLLVPLAFFLTVATSQAQLTEWYTFWITGDDHSGNIQSMYFGNALFATYCVDDGTNGTYQYYESIAPPPPPSGWDIRWKGVRTTAGNACIVEGLFPKDYRCCPYTPGQKDTFKLFFGNIDFPDSAVSFSWPNIAYLSERCDSMFFTYTDPLTSSLVKVDMFTQHTWDIPSATYNGAWIFMTIYKFGDGLVGVPENEPRQPQTIFLRQNYPNPFNPTTTISYELPTRIHVTLDVYDLLGRVVAHLVDEVQSAGSKSVSFDGQDLSSGIYIYKLNAGRNVLTRKLILLK